MRYLIVFLIALAACGTIMKQERQKEIANKVNKIKSTWTARAYDKDFRPTLGAFLGRNTLKKKRVAKRNALPTKYDLRTQFPNCDAIQEVRDQSECGSCWAFGAVEVMSDRLCIQSHGKVNVKASAQYVLACCSYCGMGCNGGWPSAAFDWWSDYGVPSGGNYGDKNTCQPYWLPECRHHGAPLPEGMPECGPSKDTPDCERTCQKGYPKTIDEDRTYAAEVYSLWPDEEEIMNDIYEYGSVSASFSVYEDFCTYEKGIYQHLTGDYLGGHAVKIIGWGEENGTKYWTVMNSWNKYWGEDGTFRIIRGYDECGIESEICAGNPLLNGRKFLEK